MSTVEYESAEGLEAFGYHQELKRTMGSYSSFALAFSMVSITTTVFTLFAQPFQTLGGAAIWLWIPATAGALVIALVYGHLVARLPVTGYAYQWSTRLVSPHYGWFTGWNALLATMVGSAGISLAFGSVFAPTFWSNPSHTDVILLSSVGLFAAVVVNIIGVRLMSWINNAGASVELFGTLGLTALLAAGLFFFHDTQGPHVLFQAHPAGGGSVNVTAIGLALLLPVYTLIGWEGSADLAEETTDPRRMAPRAMIRSVLLSGAIGFLAFAIYAMAIPGDVADTVNSTAFNPVIHIFKVQLGGAVADILQVVAFMAIFACLLANVTVATRTAFSLSRDNMLPFSKVWNHVNPSTQTPIAAITFVGIFGLGVNFLSGGLAAKILAVVSVACMLTYATSMVSVMIATRRQNIPTIDPKYFNLGRWLIPLTIAGLAWSLLVIGFMTLPKANHAAGESALGFELAGLLWYLVALRRRLQRNEAGPNRTIRADEAAPGLVTS